jgi:hypothetical protein
MKCSSRCSRQATSTRKRIHPSPLTRSSSVVRISTSRHLDHRPTQFGRDPLRLRAKSELLPMQILFVRTPDQVHHFVRGIQRHECFVVFPEKKTGKMRRGDDQVIRRSPV